MGFFKDLVIPAFAAYLAIGFFSAHWYATRASDGLYFWKHHQLQAVRRKTLKTIAVWLGWVALMPIISLRWAAYMKTRA